MAESTRKPARVKPARLCSLSPAGENGARTLTLYVGAEVFTYRLLEVPVDFGRGFRLEKVDGSEGYWVHLDDATGDSCDCKGCLKWHHCKHAESLRALIANGKV